MELKKFKKLVIDFNELAYNNTLNTLRKTIEVINSYSEVNNKMNIHLTIDDLKTICQDKKRYIDNIYQETLKDICDTFFMDYAKVKLISYTWENPMFSSMANKKCQPIYEMAEAIHQVSFMTSIVFNFIDIQDNIASPKLNYEEELKEYFTTYTTTDRENKILDITKRYKDCLMEFEKLNVPRGYIYNLLYSDFSINANTLKQC